MPSAVISGLAAGDSFLFDNATFGGGAAVTLTSGSPDVLSATLGGSHYTLHLDSSENYAGLAFDAIPTTNVHLLAAFPFAAAIEVMSVSTVGVGSSTSGGLMIVLLAVPAPVSKFPTVCRPPLLIVVLMAVPVLVNTPLTGIPPAIV